ncbi:hypothetical protein [Piscinibacter sakaiensis]|uniref:hypothetical protein n=1 Tax=Piscinibacter sakaiensis TaxID=1547922 RepID=UPI003AAB8C68
MFNRVSARQAVPGRGDLCGGEKRRFRVGERSEHQQTCSRRLSERSERSERSEFRRATLDRASQRSPSASEDRRIMSHDRVPPAAPLGLRVRAAEHHQPESGLKPLLQSLVRPRRQMSAPGRNQPLAER